MGIIATPLGWIMKGCYFVVKNYGIALLLFTILTRLITLPLQIKQQKSSARMAMLQPELEKLKKKYGKNQQKLQEEQMNLYAKAGVNPMASCLPMIIMMVILFALIPVIYGPLTYVSNLNKDDVEDNNLMIQGIYYYAEEVSENKTYNTFEKLIEKYKGDYIEENPDADEKDAEDYAYETLEDKFQKKKNYPKAAKSEVNSKDNVENVVDAIRKHNDLDKFILDESYFSSNLAKSRPELMTFVFTREEDGKYADVLDVVNSDIREFAEDFNYEFMGVSLGTIPSIKSITCIIPILCFLLQLLVTIVSQAFAKKNNPQMANMGGGMKVVMYVMPLFSLWIGFSYPLGLGLYWCYSSLFSLGQTIFLNKIYTPEHVAELVQKDIAKQKKSGKPTLMERMAEAQMIKEGKDPKEIRKALSDDDDEEQEEPKKLSKQELKNEQRRKLNEARRRMAEKYGDEYDDSQDD